jgi:hypothetical protein
MQEMHRQLRIGLSNAEKGNQLLNGESMKVMYDPKKGKSKKQSAYLSTDFIRKWQKKNIQLGKTISGVSDKNQLSD